MLIILNLQKNIILSYFFVIKTMQTTNFVANNPLITKYLYITKYMYEKIYYSPTFYITVVFI